MTLAPPLLGAPQALRWAPTDAITTTASYVTAAVYDVRSLPRCQLSVGVTEAGTNAVEFKVRGSVDGKAWDDLTLLSKAGVAFAAADIDVATSATIHAFLDTGSKVQPAYGFYDVQVRDDVAASHGSVKVTAIGKAIDGGGGPLRTILEDAEFDTLEISPAKTLGVHDALRLVGSMFQSVIDPQFWTASVSGAGAASGVASSIATLASGTANSGYGHLRTVRTARFVPAFPNFFHALIRIPTLAVALNKRRWGAYTVSGSTPQDGVYFELSAAGVLSVNNVRGGSATSVASGSFNGAVASVTMDTNSHSYEIIYYVALAQFKVDGVLIHTIRLTTAPIFNGGHFQCSLTSVNDASGVTSGTIECFLATIIRYGQHITAPSSIHISGNAATYTAKLSAGILHKIIFNNTSGTTITIYDAVTAVGGTELAIITTATAALGAWDVDLPFHTGLVVVTTGNNLDASLVFE